MKIKYNLTTNKQDLVQKISDLILSTGMNSCPPMFIGIGILFLNILILIKLLPKKEVKKKRINKSKAPLILDRE